MNKNYMIYPLKTMRITCRYDEGSHKKHNVNVIDGVVDYPIDDGGKDSEKDPIYCPCDEMKVTAIRGVGNSFVTNTIWLVSTSKVVTPTFIDYAYMTLTHSNDIDIKDMKVGQTFKRGEIISYEGTDGATSNHIHITCGRGDSSSWKQNSNGSWVISGNSMKPEDVFYIDRNFTKEIWGGYLPWITLPKEQIGIPVPRNQTKEQLEVIVNNLNARKEPNLSSEKLGIVQMGIYDVLNTIETDGYVWKKIDDFWIATQDGWVNYYPKEENNCEEELQKLKSKMPKLIYTCKKTGKYIVYLEEDKKLYISD